MGRDLILIKNTNKGVICMKVELENITSNSEMSIAKAGGISHENEIKTKEQARELNRKLIDWGHLSPIEFASSTFYVEDVSRVFLAQITRHRLASFMVQSFRYTKPDDGLVIPETIKDWANENKANRNALDQSLSNTDWLYDQLVEDGVPKEDARMVKFMGEKTKLYVRFNFREARHIIKLRGLNEYAQWEIRKFAQKILEYLYYESPSIFEDLIKEYEDNFLQGGE